MKKNWISIVSLVLNVVLLVSVISLGGKLERTEQALRRDMERSEEHIHTSIGHIEQNVKSAVKEATEQIADFSVEPVGMDAENHTLELNLQLNLRRWSADTTVQLKAVAGRDTFITALPVNGLGNCTGQISVPLNQQSAVTLSAVITTDGIITQEDLGNWWDIAAMLPIQLSSWGGSTPRYEDGAVQLGNYDVSLFDGQDQYGIPVQEPEFRLYVNDVLAVAGSAVEVEDDSPQYFVQYEYVLEPVACQPGDIIRLNFVCKDTFGLGYEFALGHWRVPAEENVLEEVPVETDHRPILSWD